MPIPLLDISVEHRRRRRRRRRSTQHYCVWTCVAPTQATAHKNTRTYALICLSIRTEPNADSFCCCCCHSINMLAICIHAHNQRWQDRTHPVEGTRFAHDMTSLVEFTFFFFFLIGRYYTYCHFGSRIDCSGVAVIWAEIMCLEVYSQTIGEQSARYDVSIISACFEFASMRKRRT